MASATWRKTGKGVAQSFCNFVKIDAPEMVLDPTAITTLGRETILADRVMQNDRTASVPAVTDIVAVGKVKK